MIAGIIIGLMTGAPIGFVLCAVLSANKLDERQYRRKVLNDNKIGAVCPMCGKPIKRFFGRNYCPDCGQALDWSGANEM